METVTLTEAEMEFIIESFFLYGFAGLTAALLFYDFCNWLVGATVRRFKSRFIAPQG